MVADGHHLFLLCTLRQQAGVRTPDDIISEINQYFRQLYKKHENISPPTLLVYSNFFAKLRV